MIVSNGDIVRNMNNQSLAEIFCTLIRHEVKKRLDNPSEVWYNENVVKGIKEWLDEPYYNGGNE